MLPWSQARKLAYHGTGGERYKVVTVDGTVINKAGLMTGGSSGGERARAARWNQQEYDTLKVSEASMVQELGAIGSLHRCAEREQAAAHRLESRQQELKTAAAHGQNAPPWQCPSSAPAPPQGAPC